VPRAKTSRRSADQDATLGGVVTIPPRDSQMGVGCTFSARISHGREVSQGSPGRERADGRAGSRRHLGRALGSKSNAIQSIPLFLFSLVASGLRILQDFAGICRWKWGIFFVFGVRERTHNLLVPGSNPGAPTILQYSRIFLSSRTDLAARLCWASLDWTWESGSVIANSIA
jgi:hypothetical protein